MPRIQPARLAPSARPSAERAPVITGTLLAVALVSIALVALVLPPLAAIRVQQGRLARVTAQLSAVAAVFDVACLGPSPASAASINVDVLVGPGDDFDRAADPRWLSTRIASLGSCLRSSALPLADPWQRPLVVNIGNARRAGLVWLLSAGPNGIIDTPFEGEATMGDDVALALTGSR